MGSANRHSKRNPGISVRTGCIKLGGTDEIALTARSPIQGEPPMPNKDVTRRWRRVLFATGAVATCGLLCVGGLRAQGLDMDAGTGAKPPAAHQSGGLDMDVNPDAPIPPKPAVQAVTGGNVQDGIAPLSGKPTADTPLGPTGGPVETPAAPATIVEQPATAQIGRAHV